MAKYETHKATATGKAQTMERKASRRRKLTPPLPLHELARELGVTYFTADTITERTK